MKEIRYDNPDIIILELVSASMEGLFQLKSICCLRNALILVLSALNTPSMVVKVLDEGVDDFLKYRCIIVF